MSEELKENAGTKGTKATKVTKTVTKKVKQGKFAALIMRTGDEVLEGRGKRTIESARAAQKKLVMDLEENIRVLEDKKELMLDQSPDNRYSLKVGEAFDAPAFVREYQDLSVKLINKRVELEIAERNSEDLFTE
jgi:hypothetical protein